MKEAGIDIFPEPDAFCYIEGKVKHPTSIDICTIGMYMD